jgi:histidinol-phosphate aminotransferase
MIGGSNRYPFNLYDKLVKRIAAYHEVDPQQVVIGTGSTEPLRNAVQAFCTKGQNIVIADPTFEAMDEFATEVGARSRRVALATSYAHDLDGMLQRIDANTALVYVCNPNNPTSSITPVSDIETFIGKLPFSAVLVHDEAYYHFAMNVPGYRSLMDRISERLIIVRSFSKVYGMAGMRLGYTVSSVANAKKLSAVRLPISITSVAAAGGIASLDDDDAMKFAAQRNAADRAEFLRQAAARKLEVIPPAANFAMIKTSKPVAPIIAAMRKKNIIIGRQFPAMPDFVRVSFGLPHEMTAFWAAWDRPG